MAGKQQTELSRTDLFLPTYTLYTAIGSSDFVCFNHLSRELGLVITNGLAVFFAFPWACACENSSFPIYCITNGPFSFPGSRKTNFTNSFDAPFAWQYKNAFLEDFSLVRLQFLD